MLIKLQNKKNYEQAQLLEQLDKLMQIEKQQNFKLEQNKTQKDLANKVTKLINEQNITANFLLNISKSVTKNIYFTAMQKKNNLVSLQGVAISYGDLGELIKRLSTINDFKNVQVLEVSNYLTKENLSLLKFELLIEFNL
jgi:hypothetical protein